MSEQLSAVELVECPRDAMQGIKPFIPTDQKVAYINQLLKCGFHTLDFGSFVSKKAVPQMSDTVEVIAKLESSERTKLLAIVGNEKGATTAAQYDSIRYLGFPFSISETFQRRNINSTIEDSFHRLEGIQNRAVQNGKEVVAYISMAFGNPYGDPWDKDIVLEWAHRIFQELEISIVSLSDTIGVATPELISELFNALIPELEEVTVGAHLHTTPTTWKEKVHAAYKSGCRRFDGAIKGYGGCPMAKDELTGNMPTEHLLDFFDDHKINHGVNRDAFQKAMQMALNTFPA